MKALIFNSGVGSRLGDLTVHNPKSMIRLNNGETIFARQLRILSDCGVHEFIVTTGPFADQLQDAAKTFEKQGNTFEFVQNDAYATTNSIYSMWLARKYLEEGDFIILHGDLVFDAVYAKKLIGAPEASLTSVNSTLPLSGKDFKARITNSKITEISAKIFDKDCVASQPFYKFSQDAMGMWLEAVDRLVTTGTTQVYAENAVNDVLDKMNVVPFSYEDHFIDEVDTLEDLKRVSESIRLFDFRQQPVCLMKGEEIKLVSGKFAVSKKSDTTLKDLLKQEGFKKPLLVCGKNSFDKLQLSKQLKDSGIDAIRFSGFTPNPDYEEITTGLQVFRESGCDSIISVGGGSAIDVAKCIKAFVAMSEPEPGHTFLDSNPVYSPTKHLACPTTAGTGSESTHFAVVYLDGTKYSLAHDSLVPDIALLDPENLIGLPQKQKVATFFDALSQAIESYWSVASTKESREYSQAAIPALLNNCEAYLGDCSSSKDAYLRICKDICIAANLAGKAINLTTTTAAHAMSYKLTSLYNIPHGLAVAMCLPPVWKALIDACTECDDGQVFQINETKARLSELSGLMSAKTQNQNYDPAQGLRVFKHVFDKYTLPKWLSGNSDDVALLASSVNAQRLGNFPLKTDAKALEKLYKLVLDDIA